MVPKVMVSPTKVMSNTSCWNTSSMPIRDDDSDDDDEDDCGEGCWSDDGEGDSVEEDDDDDDSADDDDDDVVDDEDDDDGDDVGVGCLRLVIICTALLLDDPPSWITHSSRSGTTKVDKMHTPTKTGA